MPDPRRFFAQNPSVSRRICPVSRTDIQCCQYPVSSEEPHDPSRPPAALPARLPAHTAPPPAAPERDTTPGTPASSVHGFQLLVKRDDQTGLAGGGNKTRKLELLLADALAQGCDTLLTTGAVQSNHCRQTAAAAAHAGLACHLVLGGQPPAQPNGNYLLDRLLGADAALDDTRESPATAACAGG